MILHKFALTDRLIDEGAFEHRRWRGAKVCRSPTEA